MKNTRAVYQKLREIKYYHLVLLYKRYLKRLPENCKYNCPYRFSSNGGARDRDPVVLVASTAH